MLAVLILLQNSPLVASWEIGLKPAARMANRNGGWGKSADIKAGINDRFSSNSVNTAARHAPTVFYAKKTICWILISSSHFTLREAKHTVKRSLQFPVLVIKPRLIRIYYKVSYLFLHNILQVFYRLFEPCIIAVWSIWMSWCRVPPAIWF